MTCKCVTTSRMTITNKCLNFAGNRHIATGFETNADVDIRVWDWVQEPSHQHFIGLPQHCKSKYLLNWPGNSYSAHLKYLLLCGSVVVHSDNGWYEFHYPMLTHGEHYMRIRALNSTEELHNDLTHLVQQLNRNPRHIRRIANAGQQFARETLSADNVTDYWYRLLKEYAALQTHEIRVHPDAVPLGVSVSHPRYINYNERSGCASRVQGSAADFGLPTGPYSAAAAAAASATEPDADIPVASDVADAVQTSDTVTGVVDGTDQMAQVNMSIETVGEQMAESISIPAVDESAKISAFDESESAVEAGPTV